MSTVANRRACKSCPFRRDGTTAFPTEVLEATVGSNLREGFAHNCHGTNEHKHPKVCAGFARFVVETGTANRMLDMATALGIFDPETDLDRVTDIECGSWDAVLAMHAERETLLHEG